MTLLVLPMTCPAVDLAKAPQPKGKLAMGPPQRTVERHQSLEQRRSSLTTNPSIATSVTGQMAQLAGTAFTVPTNTVHITHIKAPVSAFLVPGCLPSADAPAWSMSLSPQRHSLERRWSPLSRRWFPAPKVRCQTQASMAPPGLSWNGSLSLC